MLEQIMASRVSSVCGSHGVGFECSILQVPESQSRNGKPHQQGARVSRPCADDHGRPAGPQVDRREVRPHLCTPGAEVGVRTREAGTLGTQPRAG